MTNDGNHTTGFKKTALTEAVDPWIEPRFQLGKDGPQEVAVRLTATWRMFCQAGVGEDHWKIHEHHKH